jgi:hypothetical protein
VDFNEFDEIKNIKPSTYPVLYYQPGRKMQYLEYSTSPIHYNLTLTGYVISFKNITVRVKAEKELLKNQSFINNYQQYS